ncbi:MAG: hypothetical protein LUH18_02040 [Oscillospiraceae bacterium]|nr:hypothetical protein [Oscillospiraceae bacterium]
MKAQRKSYIPIVASLVTIVLMVLIVLFIYSNNLDNEISLIQADRNILAETPDDLADVSDVIVLAKLKDSENILITDPMDGNIITGYQKSKLEVLEVYKGDISGEDIVITEECFYVDDTLWTQQGYLPMEKDTEYILFLSAYSDESLYAGMYFPVDLEHGKYVVKKSDSSEMATVSKRSDLQIGTETNKDEYMIWYQCAIDMINGLKQAEKIVDVDDNISTTVK